MLTVSTNELTKELIERKDIITVRVEGYEKIEISDYTVEGPAVILIHKEPHNFDEI
ncbi:BC1881 family protein [Bacillus toyonensis]|uniref:BC1881 family protein n=1 Tax=Bacillus toyonensis TaxID=155322 RepID=UPI0034677DD9